MPQRGASTPRCGPSSQRGRSIAASSGWPNSDVTREHCGLRLRLAVAAHGAIGHDAAILEHRERRIEGVERQPAGRQQIERAAFERKARAAILHHHAGARQHAAGAEFPVQRLDVGDDEADRVGGAHPDGVALADGTGQREALRRSIFIASPARKRGSRQAIERVRETIGIGHDPVAHAQRPLGRFDQTVHVVEAFGLGNVEAVRTARGSSAMLRLGSARGVL